MNENPTVSIIMPAFNCESTIGESIDSVLAQTFQDWELIIIDDASTDSTLSIIGDYTKKDRRIVFEHLQQNSGSAYAKNRALSIAKGDYVAFLDSDDLWKKQKLEKQISFMNEHNSCFSFTGYEFFSDKETTKRKYIRVPKTIKYKQYLKNTIIGNSTVIMNQRTLGRVTIQEGYLEDVLTWMFYLKKGIVADGINEVLMSYRVNKKSKSGKKVKNSKRYFNCLRENQHLPLISSFFYWFNYVLNASKKRLFARKRTVSLDE